MEDPDQGSSPRWIGCPIEEDYIKENRKAGKQQRKLALSKDRSKYKKTDAKKYQKSLEKDRDAKMSKQEWLEGRVLSIMPQGVIVSYQDEIFSCVLKGLLKKDKTHAKNLVAVGDFVFFEKISPNEGIIAQIKPRFSVLSRADNLSRRKEQLIAVNIDQVLITVSVVNPPLKPPLIDRYIIATYKGNMNPVIVINKIDLLEEQDNLQVDCERELYEELIKAYSVIGIPVISISALKDEGLNELREVMKDQASVFSGQSGVGKTSLINAVAGLNLRIGDTVERTKKGSHTTTLTNLMPLEFGGWCVDTPGIKSFGVWDLKRDEIEGYFSEIHAYGLQCKFPDCTHSHEEDCAVQQALEAGELSPVRYDSYQALMASVGETHVRR
jgi:ribosome biogenesis GTPase